jgi:hypothetical protein
MSYTKQMRKKVKTATVEELKTWQTNLTECVEKEKNALIRSSLKQRIQIIQEELKRRSQ